MVLFLALFSAFAFASQPVRIQIPAEPATLDPYQVNDVLGFDVICNVMEGLMRSDGKGKVQKALAEAYEISNAGLRYTFVLRKDAKWSDGKTVKAEEFVSGLERALDPKTAAADAAMLFSIKGARDFNQGKSQILGLKAVGNKLIIDLAYVDPAFLSVLTMPLAGPFRKDLLVNGVWIPTQPSTGPYVIKAIKAQQEIELSPNPFYRQRGYLPIQYKIIPEDVTAVNLLEAGRVDVISSIPSTDLKRLKKDGWIRGFPSAATYYLGFAVKKAPFHQPDWRKAFAHAINRDSIVALFEGNFTATTSYLPTSIEGYKATPMVFPKEAAKIRAMTSKPEIVLGYAGSGNANLVMQKIQNDVQKDLGVRIRLDPMEWKAYLSRLKSDPPPVFYLGFSAPYNNALSHLKAFRKGESHNHSGYENAKYEDLVEKIQKTVAGNRRTSLLRQAQDLLLQEDTVLVPLMERIELHGVAKNIKTLQISPYGVFQLKDITR